MFGGITIVTLVLIIANVGISIYGFQNRSFFEQYKFNIGGILERKEYLRMLVSGFLHGDYMHLFFNMYVLYMFGDILYRALGPIPYIVIYFLSLFGADMLALFMHRKEANYSAIGASGAVNGVVFACILLYPGMDIRLFFILPMKLWMFGVGYMLYTLWGIRTRAGNIGHDAHLGGALIGMLGAMAFRPDILIKEYVLVLALFIPVLLFFVLIYYRPDLVQFGNFKSILTTGRGKHQRKMEVVRKRILSLTLNMNWTACWIR